MTDDQPVDCARVTVTYILGHDSTATRRPRPRAAPAPSRPPSPRGTTRRRTTSTAVFVAEYTDAGGGDLPPLTGSDQVVLEPTG